MEMTPPTDNLYKYVTILGVSIAIACSWLIVDLFNNEVKHREPLIAKAISLVGKEGPDDKLEMEKLISEAKLGNERVASFITIYGVGASVGVLISTAGCWLWYTKTQRYQDYVLRREYEHLKAEQSESESGREATRPDRSM